MTAMRNSSTAASTCLASVLIRPVMLSRSAANEISIALSSRARWNASESSVSGAFVEQARHHGAGAGLAGRILRGAALEGEVESDERNRVILDEPSLMPPGEETICTLAAREVGLICDRISCHRDCPERNVSTGRARPMPVSIRQRPGGLSLA